MRARADASHTVGGVDPVHGGQVDVHEHDIRVVAFGCGNGLHAVRAGVEYANPAAGIVLQDQRHGLADHGVVIGDDHGYRGFAARRRIIWLFRFLLCPHGSMIPGTLSVRVGRGKGRLLICIENP